VCFAQPIEVNEEIVPGFALLVAMLERFKGKERGAPGKGSYKIGVRADDVEGAADGGARLELAEDRGRIVGWGVAFEDRAGGFEELGEG
jgi:hypothetical protein